MTEYYGVPMLIRINRLTVWSEIQLCPKSHLDLVNISTVLCDVRDRPGNHVNECNMDQSRAIHARSYILHETDPELENF